MDNQTTAPEVQSEQTTDVVQNNTEATLVSENQETNFKDLIPDNFKEEKALDNFNNMEDFVKSYLHAQKLVGADKIPVPNKHATDEDWNEVFKRLGAPSTPEDYQYNLKDVEMDQSQVKEFNKTAHRLGLLPKQAEGLVKFYNEMNGNIALSQEEAAAQAQLVTETELKKEYGPQFAKRLDQAKKLAVNSLGSEFLENTYLKDGSRIGDNINVIKAFSELADKLSEDEIIKGDGSDYMTAKDIEKEINELTQEGSAYWSKTHPNHQKAVQEVLKLREMLNG
ncbi:capsid assembly protein [uncultured Mediterranean phage uvMED]|nr:capsid assembly protein [uncultured Mediterranean phage uvMED]